MSVANRFNSKKNYTNLLFHFGRVLQDAEMNELMSLFFHQISMANNLVFGNGVATAIPEKYTEKWVCPDAFALVDGRFVFVRSRTLTGSKAPGIKYRKKVITAVVDRSLLDETIGSVNEGQPGADRELIEAEWSFENPGSNWEFEEIAKSRVSTLQDLQQGGWDYVVVDEDVASTSDVIFHSLKEALKVADPGSRILVKGGIEAHGLKSTIEIDTDDLYIEFGPGVKILADRTFPQIGDDNKRSIFYITGKNVTLHGGIVGFPENRVPNPDKKPMIATANNTSATVENLRKVGMSNNEMIGSNINQWNISLGEDSL